jgi:hypothetical protein
MPDPNAGPDGPLQQSANSRTVAYEPPSIRVLGTIAELTGSGSGDNFDTTNTADQIGSGGI